MILAIDIGNTNIVIGGITIGNDGDKIEFMARLSTDRIKTEDEYGIQIMNVLNLYNVDKQDIEGGIISSVVPPVLNAMKRALHLVIDKEPLVVGPGIKTGLNILMDNPGAVGSDLIISAVAGISLYKPPLIIVDMGTATTIIVVDKNKNFIGGCIMPGVNVSLRALTSSTAQLPEISLDNPRSVIGKNTIDCMKSGVIYGSADMVEGYLNRIEQELEDDANILVTGGLGKQICKHCKRKDLIYCDDLLLIGLSEIYKKNVK